MGRALLLELRPDTVIEKIKYELDDSVCWRDNRNLLPRTSNE